MQNSARFTLNRADVIKWIKNALIFLGPALLVLIASLIKAIPSDLKNGALVLYVLNVLYDLLRKWINGEPQ